MLVEIRKPVAELRPFVKELIYYTAYSPDYFASRMLPEPSIELLIPLDDEARVFNTTASETFSCNKSFVSGIHEAPLLAMASGESMFAVRFTHAGAKAIFHLPASELRNRFIDATCLLGKDIRNLRSQLLESDSTATMFCKVETYLIERIREDKRLDLMTALLESLPTSEGLSMKKLADYAGYSHKQLISLFRDFVGVTPKMYQRLNRFQQALDCLSGQDGADWLDLAYRFGYYDQAHFINEFRTFSGYTPTHYLQIKGDYPNYIPLQKDLTPPEHASIVR